MKELIKSSLIGALIGIAILMLCYVGVYYIEGKEVYENEILQLTQIEVLQSQLILTAFYGALFVTTMNSAAKLIQNENKKVYNPMLGSIVVIIVECIFVFSIYYIGQFSKNIKSMIVISNALLLGIYFLLKCVMIFWEEIIINKKIKEKNAQQPEKGN